MATDYKALAIDKMRTSKRQTIPRIKDRYIQQAIVYALLAILDRLDTIKADEPVPIAEVVQVREG